MDKWATLEPVRLHDSSGGTSATRSLGPASAAARILGRTSRPKIPSQPYIGPLPVDVHIQIVSHLPITTVPTYARASRATAALCRNEKIWQKHWSSLGVDQYGFAPVLDRLQTERDAQATKNSTPATMNVVEQDILEDDDDFGAFTTATSSRGVPPTNSAFDMGDFVTAPPISSSSFAPAPSSSLDPTQKTTYRQQYIRAHTLLKPLLPALLSPPHVILSTLFPPSSETSSSTALRYQSQILHLLTLFISPALQPVLAWPSLLSSLRAAIDRFEAALLSAFDSADRRGDETGMKDAAWASWEVFEGQNAHVRSAGTSFLGGGGASDWEMGKVWAEKKEIFYESGRWDPIRNFTSVACTVLAVTPRLTLPLRMPQFRWRARLSTYG